MPNISQITHNGRTLSLKEWAETTGLSASTIAARLHKLGWDVGRALETPAGKKFARGGRGGRKPIGTPRACPPLKPRKGAAFARWWVNGIEHSRCFGPWGSDEARENYARFTAEWAAGLVMAGNGKERTIAEMIEAWLGYCKSTYRKRGKITSEYHCAVAAVRELNRLYGEHQTGAFDGRKLRAVREAMAARGWVRDTINKHVARIVRCFGWGATEAFVPASVHDTLKLVEPIPAGRRDDVPEGEPVKPVPLEHVTAVLVGDRLHPTPARRSVLAVMVRVQLLTGMRPGELCSLRAEQIERAQTPWKYQVTEYNKTLHKNVDREVYFGPQARGLLADLLDRTPGTELVFRYAPWRKGAAATPITTTGYRARIKAACRAAGVEAWTPNQLRHNKATELMNKYEDDRVVSAILGNSAEVARQVYADNPGAAVARRIAEAMG